MQNRYNRLLKPLCEKTTQCYLGREVHVAGLLDWILNQTGPARVIVTTFSTSDDFLCSFIRLRKQGLIKFSTLLADFRASKKTHQLGSFMRHAFDIVRFAENHSKLMLVSTPNMQVTVLTSQNQTYGSRYESTMVTTDAEIFDYFEKELGEVLRKSVSYEQWNSQKSN